MDSQEWAAEFPTVSVRVAKTILASHGFDHTCIMEFAGYLYENLSHDEWQEICEIDNNYEVSSQQLVNWLGY
jgi:hypothetical protein